MPKQVILCVDDEESILISLRQQIRSLVGNQFDIEISLDPIQALNLLAEFAYEKIETPLIISDYIMPVMKGDEFLKKAHEISPNTLKILLTGHATIGGIQSAINQAHLYRYIAKPWEKEDLGLAITEAIKSFRMGKIIEEQNHKLQEHNRELLAWSNAFIEGMVGALDTRDTTTVGHSKRLAAYAVKMAEVINNDTSGVFKNIVLSETSVKELYYAALLHDIGKIGVREQILLKQYRLSNERQLAIKYRFNWYKTELKLKSKLYTVDSNEQYILDNIDRFLEFITDICVCDNYITSSEKDRISEIANIQFIDLDGNQKNLLDSFEFENLTVSKGNLTEEERRIVCTHAEFTYNILRNLPWPKGMENVPFIASCHHEKLDGSGYFRGLKGDDIPLQSRILAIVDIYEALTSPDRPYKKPKSPQVALEILKSEVNEGLLDKDLFQLFIDERIYELNEKDMDDVNIKMMRST